MPSPSAHSATDSLRTAHRRLWLAAAVGTGAAVGLLPLVYVLPVPAWQRAVLGGLALLYLACKGYRLHRARQTVQRLRLESCFIGHSFSGRQLRRCLRRRGHLWTHSYTVRALRRLMARPLPNLLVTPEKRQRVHAEYRRALEGLCPSRLCAGLPLGLLLAGGVFTGAAATGGVGGSLWLLRAGLACALVLVGAEGTRALCCYRAQDAFTRLTDALAGWTLARSVHKLLHGRTPDSYRHTPLYRAPAWFAGPPAPARGPAPGEASASSCSSERRAA
jgi:hypothetical protein